jgi:acyl-CoA thioesterase-2
VEVDESEFMGGTLAELVEGIVARPVRAGPDGKEAFVTTSPNWWGGERTFGGMVVAQALYAAILTVPGDLDLHSLHGYFLRPSPSGSRSIHRVERVRDGRTFTVREVISEVEGRATFRMTCSFHRPEDGDEYQLPMAPDIEIPLPDGTDGPDATDDTDGTDGIDAPFAFDVRDLGATERREDGTYLSTRRCWFRTTERLPDDPALHAGVLAYLSDMTGAAFRPHSLSTWGRHADASLDHAMWFHRPRRADEWNLFDHQALVNAGGRATIRSTMYGGDGLLYLSMAQELLIREISPPRCSSPAPL